MNKVDFVATSSLLITSVFSYPALSADLTLDGAADFTNHTGDSQYVGTASYTDKLNTNGTGTPGGLHTGFESFFTSTNGSFGRLGTTTNSTQSTFTSGITRRVSTPFRFSASALEVLNSTQSVKFDYAFDGTAATVGNTSADPLIVYIAPSGNPTTPVGITPLQLTINTYTNPGGARDAGFTVDSSVLNSLTDYVVTFELEEGFLGGDSAAGFDNVRISNASAVPFEFSPGIGIFALGICGVLNQLKNTMKNKTACNPCLKRFFSTLRHTHYLLKRNN